MNRLFNFSNLTLLVALSLSTIAAYYSIIGLTAIFAGAVIPIIVMGSVLEVGKVTTTVWLRKYWHLSSFMLKAYLVPAVVMLAFLTSMGIFGFLSKAHTDQNLISGDVMAKLAIYDEKINVAKENVEANKKALKQLDEAVDQVMARSSSEEGAARSFAMRKAQAKDRQALAKMIESDQKLIAQLNEEAAPIRAEIRKVEADVGPVKYIAAFIYGDNPDSNLLEAAVRWVIILIVAVFDPLAIALVLAANASKVWDSTVDSPAPIKNDEAEDTLVSAPAVEEPIRTTEKIKEDTETARDDFKVTQDSHPYLFKPWSWVKNLPPLTAVAVEDSLETKKESKVISADELDSTTAVPETPVFKEVDDRYVVFDGKMISKDALKEIKPELFKNDTVVLQFGTKFPKTASKGNMFMRIDVQPHQIFKFDGRRWFGVNKDVIDGYFNEEYMKVLIDQVDSGVYNVDLLSEREHQHIEVYRNTSKEA